MGTKKPTPLEKSEKFSPLVYGLKNILGSETPLPQLGFGRWLLRP